MNHIVAALFVIGIVFGVITAGNQAVDLEDLQSRVALVSGQMEGLPDTDSPDALAASLAPLEAAVDTLVDVQLRLPRELETGADRMKRRIGVLRDALEADDSEAAAAALNGIRSAHGEIQTNSNVGQFQLHLVSLAVQAREMTNLLYARAGLSVEIAISLIGIMALWLGIMRVAEEAGIIQALANLLRPILRLLFPGIPKEHPANGALLMAMSANILGLDNAATPLGIKAMQELQTLNTDKPTITTNQIMHLALSTSSLNLIPFSIIGYRIAEDSAMPNDIIVPVIIATTVSSAVAIIMTYLLKGISKDPAAVGEEAERITREINAELHAALEGENDKEGQS